MDVDGEVDGVGLVQIEQTLGSRTLEALLVVTDWKVLLWVDATRESERGFLVDS